MTKLQHLNRKMLELERNGDISEGEYATYKALLGMTELALLVAAQDPFTFSDDADLPYKQLANIVNVYQSEARGLLEKLK